MPRSSNAGQTLLHRESSCPLWSRNSEETGVARVEQGRARAAGGGLRVQRGGIRSCRRKTGKHWQAERTFPHCTIVWIAHLSPGILTSRPGLLVTCVTWTVCGEEDHSGIQAFLPFSILYQLSKPTIVTVLLYDIFSLPRLELILPSLHLKLLLSFWGSTLSFLLRFRKNSNLTFRTLILPAVYFMD